MYGFYGFSSIREGIIFIAVNSVLLAIALLYDYRRKQLEKKHKELKLISDKEMCNGLMAKVEAAQKTADNKTRSNILNALINQIKAQSGKKIEKGFADLLINDISNIQNNLK